MEERYTLGLAPFTPEYPDPDPEPSLPIFPLLGAQRSYAAQASNPRLADLPGCLVQTCQGSNTGLQPQASRPAWMAGSDLPGLEHRARTPG